MIKNIMVIGAGLMGSGIAQAFATANYNVILLDSKYEFAQKGLDNIKSILSSKLEKNKITKEQFDSILNLIKISDNYEDGKDVDIAIEAVNENIELKKEVFRKLDSICNEKTILTSNTSTLSITSLASETKRKDKVIGMHFFIPAPVMKLVEIIPSLNTSAETLEVVKELTKKLDKIFVIAKDFPGFIVNRLAPTMWNEAMFLVMEGVEPEDIDNAMKYGTNMAMGPLELADFAGLDTVLAVMQSLYNGFNDQKYRPCPLLIKMVEAGKLGRKTCEGFYKY